MRNGTLMPKNNPIRRFTIKDGETVTTFDQQSRTVDRGEDPCTIYVPPRR